MTHAPPPLIPTPPLLLIYRLWFSIWRFRALPRAQRLLAAHPAGRFLERPLWGNRMLLDPSRSDTHRLLYVEGERFLAERYLLQRLVADKRYLVDVGANIGYYMLLLARFSAPDARIVCVEPSSENLPELEANIQANSHLPVSLSKAAVGNKRGKVWLRKGINSGVVQAGHGTYEVEVLPLDDIVSGPADFVKIDVEGYEYNVLMGAIRLMRGHGPTMFVEMHPKGLNRQGASVAECLRLLGEHYDHLRFFRIRQTEYVNVGIKKALHRFAYLYLNADPVEEFSPSAAEIDKMDAEAEWGTFWVVAQ